MFNALFYLQFNSVKNRLTMQFKRLKRPKYFIFLVVGGLYLYGYFFRVMLSSTHHGHGKKLVLLPDDPLLYEPLSALILFVIILLAWVIPHKRASLTFTEAEVAFLFPAPVTRQGLIHFKLVRSQFSIFIGVLLFTFISNQFSVDRQWLILAAGWWLILSTLNLHFIASSFAVTKLMDRGISSGKRRLIVLTLVLIALGVVIGWTMKSMPALTDEDLANARTFMDYAKQALMSGPLLYLLFPFRLVVRPYLTHDWLAFAIALWPALLLMLVHYIWVLRADVSFEEASVDASRKQAEKIAVVRSGNWRIAGKQLKQKRAPFRLRPTGSPAIALFWKNLINAGNLMSPRLWIILVVVAVAMSSGLHGGRNENWAMVIGMFATMFGGWTLLIGPQFVRQDFRHDLRQMDVLKVFPLPGWQIALGEILAPLVILTSVHWLLLIVAVTCLAPNMHGAITGDLVVAIGVGAAVVLPPLNLISLLIPNGAVLLFPAWFQTGVDSPRGIEATGQRLVFAIGQFLAFIVALIPAAGVFLLNFFVARWMSGSLAMAVVMSSFTSAVILAVEASFGVVLLGYLFKRFDVSSESTA